MKRALRLIVIMLLCFSLLASCGGADKKTSSILTQDENSQITADSEKTHSSQKSKSDKKKKHTDSADDDGENGDDDDNDDIESKKAEVSSEDLEQIKALKIANAKFKKASFGSSDTYSRFSKTEFGKPTVYPTKNQHPRVLFTDKTLNEIENNLQKSENYIAYLRLLASSNESELTDALDNTNPKSNLDKKALMKIEAMAFRYAITRNELYAERAIIAIKNTILKVDASGDFDPYRAYGAVMTTAAFVYDWCYDVLTEADKEQIVNGVLNNLAQKLEIGCPPEKEGAISHHTMECQLQKSYLSFAIAVYDEYPDIYNYVAGRLINQIAPAQNFMLKSNMHWEGTEYGQFRFAYQMWGQILFSVMSNGKFKLYNETDLHNTATTFAYTMLPDSKDVIFEIGDGYFTNLVDLQIAQFFAASYFDDPYLYGISRQLINKDTTFENMGYYQWVSPIVYLVLNDPDIEEKPFDGNKNLATVLNYPQSGVLARSAWNSSDTVSVYMNMKEFFSSSHSHADCGSFEIFYKGLLASDSGTYDSYGSLHHYAYGTQTIASNSLLIYNTDFPKTDANGRVYSGGQKFTSATRVKCPTTLENAKAATDNWQATVTGKKVDSTKSKLHYAYLGGDMTNAYDSKTVDGVSRHMLSVMTSNKDCPMVFAVYDRVSADKASYKKSVLLHSHTQPSYSNGVLTVDNGQGKLVTQSLLTDMSCTVYGINNSAYTMNSTAYEPTVACKKGNDYRIELSPKTASKTDKMLTVMYVCDSSVKAIEKAVSVENAELSGVSILGCQMMFAKDTDSFGGKSSFAVKGSGSQDVFVAALKAGKWTVKIGSETKTVTVSQGEGIMNFTANGGTTVSISYAG